MSASASATLADISGSLVRETGKMPAGVGHCLKHIPDLAAALGKESNDLVRCFLASRPHTFLDAMCDTKMVDDVMDYISDACGWKPGMAPDRVPFIVNRPKRGRPIGDCYNNALAEFRETGNPPVIGQEMAFVGNIAYLTPHAFNYDPKTHTYYDTDTPVHTKRLGRRPALVMMSLEESTRYLTTKWVKGHKYGGKEDLAATRGVWFLYADGKEAIGWVRYSVKDIGHPTETRTPVASGVFKAPPSPLDVLATVVKAVVEEADAAPPPTPAPKVHYHLYAF